MTHAPAASPPARGPWRLGALALAAALAGCSFVPTYERPAAPVASDWPDSAGAQAVRDALAASLDKLGVHTEGVATTWLGA